MTTSDTTTPPARFPDRPLDQATERWWLAKVKPRQEKQLAADFLAENIEYYLRFMPVTPPARERSIGGFSMFPFFRAISVLHRISRMTSTVRGGSST